jgi:uncharacterized protein YktB (UPF0637 family)
VPFEGFIDTDYDVFEIPGFAERMAAIRAQIRPKLVEIGAEIVEGLRPEFGPEFYAHVASHMRRRVNPPPDTWVAFGPSKKGYKAYPHLSVGVGYDGPYVEFIVMEESDHKALLSENLQRNAKAVAGLLNGLEGMSVHLDHHARDGGLPSATITPEALCGVANEVIRLKGNEFMVACPLPRSDPRAQGRALIPTALDAFRKLEPLYRCALEPDLRL